MHRDMCTKCSALLAAAVLALWISGCAMKSTDRWIDPDRFLEVASKAEIQAAFSKLFSKYSNTSERFSISEVGAGNARFLFVSAYPYRGRAVFAIYCFEEGESNAFQLRAIIPVNEARNATPSFIANGDSVIVMIDGASIFRVDSVAATIRQSADGPVQPF